ncbi:MULTISPECIES: 2-hydroxyacid dehydrogenase [Actibacterium]|uniref:Lactate dehydrogenase-like 2-hydroxyacid dehydrogenase n=1 Tax=Actibacterium naphthalenivorans TaxID=1614693 RepID=A0A840C7D5_9RHOB|nr:MULTISPECIES: D-glycerate dehydrogenase [Actibacterium]ALG89392.1 2-hydroxyacid dehydrogenase [Actibacterium sp. EMB200-NS6]MBB4020990.1 lactate dehydrogenase-like 2-hydroxyacid dehydrogenase [Actibacterium naphthalenivorans]
MARILITRPLPEAVCDAVRDFAEVEVRASTAPMKPAEMRASLTVFDAVLPTLGDAYDAEIFDEVPHPRARLLANFGVGYNHIDVAAARAAGVTVTNTPGAVTDATADIALTLILMSCRRAAEGERLVRSGAWQGWHPTQMLGQHVSGKTLGIVGMGRIGKAIARRCHHGFGMDVVFFNRSPVDDPGVPATPVESIAKVARAADVLVTAVPGGASTRHLIGAEVFEAMKPTAHFVNIARGDVVDETALISALQTGQIAGAGLDVYEFEPEVPEALRALDNVTLLPHLGTAALEVRAAMGMMAVENIRAFLAGETPPNVV